MGPNLPLVLEVGTAGILAWMSYQDWQTRSITWFAFPLLGLTLLALHLLREHAGLVALQVAVNWGLLVVLLAVLTLYVRLRLYPLSLGDCLGSGDVLYWAVVALYFSPPGFLLYFLSSSLVALATAGLARWRAPAAGAEFRIPLAGVQAACLLLLLGVRVLVPSWHGPEAAVNLLTVLTP